MVFVQEWQLKMDVKSSADVVRKVVSVSQLKQKKILRLNRAECQEVFKQSSRFKSSFFTFLYKRNDLQTRLAILLPKKKIKLATQRNLLRRQIREHIRKNQHNMPAIDLVVLLNKQTAHSLTKEDISLCLDPFIDALNKL